MTTKPGSQGTANGDNKGKVTSSNLLIGFGFFLVKHCPSGVVWSEESPVAFAVVLHLKDYYL